MQKRAQTRTGPGRPPRYGRPSKAVTVTLPEDVLARLGGISSDLGHAIVQLVSGLPARRVRAAAAAELADYGHHAVIVVTPVRTLQRLPGVQLVPVGGGRALISLDGAHSIPQLELELRDALAQSVPGRDRETLEAITDILREARQSKSISVEERTIIVLESKRQWASSPDRKVYPFGKGTPAA